MLYQWVVFFHILGAIGFFMAHGASAVMSIRLQQERDIKRIQAILDLSKAALPAMYISLLVLLIAGIAAGIMRNWFQFGWIWTALVLMFLLMGGMYYYVGAYFTPIRKAVGLPYRERGEEKPAQAPLREKEIEALIKSSNPTIILGVSFAVVAVILWLMVLKPF
jgi:hypothetical protein